MSKGSGPADELAQDSKIRLASKMQHDTVLVLVSLTNVLFFSGIMFGWAPFLVMLEEEGQYAEVCAGAEGGCADQAARFALIFAVATFLVNGISLPSGILLDRCGGGAMTALAAACTGGGLAMLGASDSRALDLFLPGYALVTVGGQATLFSALPAAFLLPGRQTLVLALVSCLFDGSCVVFQVLSSLRHATGATRRALFVGYALFSVPCYFAQAFLWARRAPRAPAEEAAVHDYGSINSEAPEEAAARGAAPSAPKPRRVAELPLPEQLASAEFGFILLFASLGVLRANLYIATNEALLDNLGDAAPGPRERLYSRLFGYLMPMGFLFVPAIDRAVARSLRFALGVTNALAVAVAGLMLARSLDVQVVNFLVFAGFRAFLCAARRSARRGVGDEAERPFSRALSLSLRYGVMSAYIAQTFGLRTLGRITGCVFTFGAVVNLLQAPIVNFMNFELGGDTDLIALGMLAVGLGMFVPVCASGHLAPAAV